MTRKETETIILEKLMEIKEVYSKYNPDGRYLTMAIIDDAIMCYNASYKEADADYDHPIDIFLTEENDND